VQAARICYYAETPGTLTVKVFDLLCANDHRFEGWFTSGADFEQQRERGYIACPMCGDSQVVKVPAASYVNTRVSDRAVKAEPAETPPAHTQYANFRSTVLAKVVEYVMKNTEDVGREFPEEARKIHYGESPERKIRGIASQQEVSELRDEGIEVVALPVTIPAGKSH
jgi:hypothetical protein